MFTFLKAQGYEVGKSKYDDNELDLACKLLSKKIILPIDVVLNDKKMKLVGNIPKSKAGYDIGPMSVKLFSDFLKNAKTIIWNGPMGLFEIKPFDKATKDLAKIKQDKIDKIETKLDGLTKKMYKMIGGVSLIIFIISLVSPYIIKLIF